MSAITDWSALGTSEAIRQREVSCVDVARAHLDRVDALDPTFHALISRRPRDAVLAEAAERDGELDHGMWRGWMHGLPHAVKDLSDVRGLPTSLGFRSGYDSPVAAQDDPFVGRIRAAGAVFIGKTNTPEFGVGSHTYNGIGPTTGNVVDPALSAGGSSGGAAVAVATGMVPVADGSDFMGSLRNPPGWNGVFGLRPTPGTATCGVDGPIARTIGDLSALLTTMAEPGLVGRPALTPAHDEQPRVAWLGDLDGYLPFDDGVLEVCRDAVERMTTETHVVSLPRHGVFTSYDQLWPAWLALRHHEVGGWLAAGFDADEIAAMKPEAQWELEGFRALTHRQLDHARRVQHDVRLALLTLFGKFDLLALPTAQCWPFPVSQHWPASVAGVAMDTYHRWMEVTTLATMAGCPALAAPAGVNGSGLHMGVQLIARPGDESGLLGWAAQAERRGVIAVASPSAVAGH